MTQPIEKPKRRVRYSGTHPKTFEEKYKELQPDKYEETIAKVIQKGNTPAGMHRSICVQEILNILQIKPGQTGLDCTLGYGGHTQEMLACLQKSGHLYAIDADPIELPRTKKRLHDLGYGEDILTIESLNFKEIDALVEHTGPFDFILADLGVSSMQIDNPSRGFSFKMDGPLDLRMNPQIGIPVSKRLTELSYDELVSILQENADEPNAEVIAKATLRFLKTSGTIETTLQLKQIIADALFHIPIHLRNDEIKKACQRSFQALRIDINHEYDALSALLDKLPDSLAKNGRVAILTFHSGEDRLVKKSFQSLFRQGVYQEIAQEIIRPSMEEQNSNSRARSAKLRYAIKA
ncbi:MAG: 16S rRNA (cytosine(1402)-N(4))-methyltransferase RsmH [bacterium]|jgi:16S rRNA (cytosine1402-N4)-methyltransferase|nr:16S rRNA (cytosine(1402)-N(4))-methyltransferase RsmH [bacterium]